MHFLIATLLFFGIYQAENTATDGQAFLRDLDTFYASVSTIQADFKQQKNSSLFVEALLSSGKFYFEKPDKIRWEEMAPNPNYFVINGDTFIQFDGKKKTTSKKSMQAAAFKKFILNTIDGSIFRDPGFSKTYAEEAGKMHVELTPLDKKLKKHIQSIHLVFNTKNMLLDEMKISENETEETLIRFTNQLVNKKQPATLYQ